MKRYNYLLILIILIIILIYILNNNTIEYFINSTYVKKASGIEAEYLYPILKNIFDENIELSDSQNKYDLIILYDKQGPSDNKYNNKYIYVCGEKKEVVNHDVLNDPNCVAAFIMDSSIEHEKVFYLPFFLNVGSVLQKKSPFIKNNNTKRDRLAAYIAHHSPLQRDKMFEALRNLDASVDGLGKANHTRDVELPEGWWNLDKVYKDYKFGFAMENADQDGYITEKIMNVYRGGAVPIYWGTYKVKEIFHPDSFIYVNDYSSFEEAAKDIVAIANDPERYEAMRTAPIFLENSTPDYSKYYDSPSPQWVIDIANRIKEKLNY